MRLLIALGLISLVGCTPTPTSTSDDSSNDSSAVELIPFPSSDVPASSGGRAGASCLEDSECSSTMVCVPVKVMGGGITYVDYQCQLPPSAPATSLCDQDIDCEGKNNETSLLICDPLTVRIDGALTGICVGSYAGPGPQPTGFLCAADKDCASGSCHVYTTDDKPAFSICD